MLKLKDAAKRGRPDLLHFALLEATSTPLYQKGMMEIYVHTVVDKVILFHGNVRLPKSYFRFEGLMEELFKDKKIESDTELLIEVKDMQFTDLLDTISPENVIGLSRSGVKSSAEQVARNVNENSALVIGGFPRGHFSSSVSSRLDNMYSISEYGLEAHVVIARILYECEKRLIGGY
jgi:rRNA small subunit pseudouridine methyltransferase Nep1